MTTRSQNTQNYAYVPSGVNTMKHTVTYKSITYNTSIRICPYHLLHPQQILKTTNRSKQASLPLNCTFDIQHSASA